MEREIPPLNCREHPKLLLSFYCPSHDAICCENCKQESHSSCSEIQRIREASKGITEKHVLTDLSARFEESKESLSATTDKLEDNISTLSRQYDSIKENIQTARKAFSVYFDELESELTSVVHVQCIKNVEDRIVELERRKYTLEQWEDEVQAAVRSDDDEIIFSVLNIMNELQNDMESYLNATLQEIKFSEIRWKPIKTDKRSIETFVGKLSLSESVSKANIPDTARSRHNLNRASSRVSENQDTVSIGNIDINGESKAEQGLDGIATRTKQGWNDISSNVKDEGLDATGFKEGLSESRENIGEKENKKVEDEDQGEFQEEISDKHDEDMQNKSNANIEEQSINEPEKHDKQSNEHKDNLTESMQLKREKHIDQEILNESGQEDSSVDTFRSQEINLSGSVDDSTKNTSMTANKRVKSGSSRRSSAVGKRIHSAKSKFEATVLDKKSNAEVKKGLFLSPDTLLFLDTNNKHIFICNKSGKVNHRISLMYEPEDVTLIDDARAVVTLGEQGIQTINVKTLKKDHVHDVGGCCGGIAAYKGQIIVSVDEKLRLLDTFGYTLRRITHDGCASAICLDSRGRIYYTDSMNHTLHCLAWYGIPVFTYSNKHLRCPIGIAIDSNFFVYVAGFESSNVQKLWPNGRFHSEFLSENDGLYEPSCLDYCKEENELLVVSDNNQSIETYELNDHKRIQQ